MYSQSQEATKSIFYNKAAKKAGLLKQIELQQKYADSAFYFAQKTSQKHLLIRSITSQINPAIAKQDTIRVNRLFAKGFQLAKAQNISPTNNDFLAFQIRNIHYNIRFGNKTSDEGLKAYKEIYQRIKSTDKYPIITEVLGRISLLYRNRKELGKALNYNLLEQKFAVKSDDFQNVASSKITELDISYQLIPRPIKSKEDVIPLIEKAKEAALYMKNHKVLDILPFAQLYLAKFYIHETSYEKSEKLLLSLSDSLATRIVFSKYEQLCEIAKSTNNIENYKRYSQKFKPVAYSTKRPFVALNVHNYLLDYFVKTQQRDSASFYAKRLEKNLQQVDTTQFLDYVNFSYDVLSSYYKDLNKDKSLAYKTYANTVAKQIIEHQKEAFVNIIKYRKEVQDLENKNADLTANVSFFRGNMFTILLVSLLLLVVSLYLFKANRKSIKASKQIEEEKNKIIETVERKHIILNNKQKVYFDELMYVKSDRNYVEFHLEAKKIVDRNKLLSVAEKLPPNFVKIHRSYIVNKNFIKVKNTTSVILESSHEIPVSRTYKEDL